RFRIRRVVSRRFEPDASSAERPDAARGGSQRVQPDEQSSAWRAGHRDERDWLPRGAQPERIELFSDSAARTWRDVLCGQRAYVGLELILSSLRIHTTT